MKKKCPSWERGGVETRQKWRHICDPKERERERGSERGMEAKMGLEKEEERQR